MSDDPIISVENLGKRYRIQHQQAGGMRYKTFRDTIAAKFKSLVPTRKSEIVNRKSEEDFWALKDVSFQVKRGEVVGIIGRNGAGKSTLLKILSRITEPTEGRVRLKGRVASLLEVGTGFHPELTGRENIFLNGAILGMSKVEIKSKFDEIVAFAEVEQFLDTPVKRYSSGMYVRLAFAVAAHLEPEILILDEVLAVGDAEFQKKCLGKMESVSREEGRTVLFVSHNMAAISQLCRRSLLFKDGSIAKGGATVEVINHYLALENSSKRYSRNPPKSSKPQIIFAQIEVGGDQDNIILNVSLTIRASSPSNCSIEIIIADRAGSPVGFAAAGLQDPRQMVQLTEGDNAFKCNIGLPSMAKGNYNLNIQIAQPWVEMFDKMDTYLGFELMRLDQQSNRKPLDQSWGYGCLDLELQVHPILTDTFRPRTLA